MEGFAPECAWVTYGGSEKLEERYCIRPTSETLFCEHYKNIIHSHRDLPKLYNQWCSVLRWEKTSRPFEETMRMLNIYADFMENVLAMPVVKGRKTDKEKFNGAEETYTVECMMHDRKALQAGTTGKPSRRAPATTSATASPGPLTSPSPARTTSFTTPTRPPGGCPPA